MQFPPSSHFIYIPAIFVLGIVLGFIFGSRATREAYRLEQKAADERARRQAERAARKAQEGKPPAESS